MMDVPILDAAWMERRARARSDKAWMDAMASYRRGFTEPAKDTPESLREQYALGKLTFEEFERRTERMLT